MLKLFRALNPQFILAGLSAAVLSALMAYLWGKWVGVRDTKAHYMAEIATMQATWKEEKAGWVEIVAGLSVDLHDGANHGNAKLQGELDARSRDLAAALERERLRHQADRDAPALKPAGLAPAECRGYEATPGLLPLRDRTLLLEFLDQADRGMLERASCGERYERAKHAIDEVNSRATARAAP